MRNDYIDDKPQFNMAILFLERLDKRLEERDEASINGRLVTWYRVLRNIYRSIYFKLEENKQEDQIIINEIEKLFDIIKNLLSNQTKNNSIEQLTITKSEEKLDELDKLLNNLLYKYNLIFPKKVFKSFEEEIQADFG